MELFVFVSATVIYAVLGLCFGSFLNVVVYRLPRGLNLARPGSHCTKCNHPLAWYDNIPLLSFIILRGRCRYCKEPISPRYFVVEALNCLLWAMCAAVWRDSLPFAAVAAVALSVLLAMALCDADQMFIPDSLQLCLLVTAVVGIFTDEAVVWSEKLIGLAVGLGFFLLFYLISFPMFGREGLGFGDVKLMGSAGLLLGYKAVCCAIIFALMPAFIAVVARRLTYDGRSLMEDDSFPFAPYLAFGICVALFFGNELAAMYLTFIS